MTHFRDGGGVTAGESRPVPHFSERWWRSPCEKSDLPVEKTLLVVDDEESLRSFFHEILTKKVIGS
jgi:hypothetical protein